MLVPNFPKRIEIEPTSACNLKCTYCPRHFVKGLNRFMDISIFKKIIKDIESFPETVIVLHRRGESLLHPQFSEMLNLIKGKFQEIQLATNATLLDSKLSQVLINSLTFISFSIDSPNQYEKTRIPAKYKKVESNIHKFIELNNKKGSPVKTQVSMVKTNESVDFDLQLFEKQWIGKVDRIRIYEAHSENGTFGSLKKMRKDRKPCFMPFYELVILCDGSIARCNHDWHSEPVGYFSNGIQNVWHNSFFQSLRKQHESLMITDPVCATCDSWYPEEGHQCTGKVIEND